MTKKTQTHSAPDPQEFMKLWQEKWGQMMKEKGWPESMAMPNMGQTPFSMPFMPGFSGFGSNETALQSRIEELEQRIAKLEKKLAQRNKPVAKKATRKR